MKSVKAILVGSVLTGLFTATSANAQLNISSVLGGPSSGNSSNAATDNVAAQDALVKSFVASQIEVLTAQSLLAQAYGLKDQAQLCDDQAKALQSTSVDTDTLKKTVDVSTQANDLITAQQNKESTLSDEGKQYYIKSLPHFARGIIGTHDVVSKAAHFASGLKSSGTNIGGLLSAGTGKLKAGLFIAQATPSYSMNLFDVFRKTVSIGQSNGVTPPSDVTSALGSLS